MAPTPVFLRGKFHGQRNLEGMVHGVTKSQTQLRMYTHTHTHTHTPTLLSSTVGLSGRNLQSRSVGSRLYSPLINYYYFGKTQVSHQ